MEYCNLELVGIEEIVDIRGRGILSRYPQAVNDCIKHNTAYQLMGSEIRFVPLSDCAITIGSMYCFTQSRVQVFYGDYGQPEEYVFAKEITIDVSKQRVFRDQDTTIPRVLHKPHGFQHNVVRIVVLSEALYIKKMIGCVRIPKRSEVPCQKIMCYGTSITQGCSITSCSSSYAFQLARYLQCDLYNYALSGHAFLEKEVCDFLMTRNMSFDYIVLELSVNMLMEGFDAMTLKKNERNTCWMV